MAELIGLVNSAIFYTIGNFVSYRIKKAAPQAENFAERNSILMSGNR